MSIQGNKKKICNLVSLNEIDIKIQRTFPLCYERNSPERKSIKRWNDRLNETGNVADLPRSDKPCVREATVERDRQTFHLSPTQSTRAVSFELQISAFRIAYTVTEDLLKNT